MGLEFPHVDMELADRFVVPELRQCALLLDIDGTILDLAPAPQEVWVPAELRNTLSRLEDLTGGALALVSGRSLHDIDLIFCCGPMMHALWHALPANRRGGYAEDSAALEAQVLPAIRAGDVVMVKGSLGSHMAPIVKALQRAYPRYETMANASVQG